MLNIENSMNNFSTLYIHFYYAEIAQNLVQVHSLPKSYGLLDLVLHCKIPLV